MKNKSLVLYAITIISVILNLILLKALSNPEQLNLLVKLGLLQPQNGQDLTHLLVFVFVFSIITCLLLLLSFIILIYKLFRPNKIKL